MIMKTLFFSFLLLVTTGCAFGQRSGLYGGVALGYFHYNTHWYYHAGSASPYYDNYAAHSTGRTSVTFNLEQKGIASMTHFQFDLGGELLLGVAGGTHADYLGGDNAISSGGFAAGINAYGRAVYLPTATGKGVRVYPFVSAGPHYMFLHNNGKGSSSAIGEYDYGNGWNEGVLMMAASLGVDFQFEGFTVTPEFRFGLFGWNSSSWAPGGRDVTMNGGPGFTAFSVRLSKRL
jgi:hypothetical protein